MIIYYAMTKYHLIFSMTHKLKNYGKQYAVLFYIQDYKALKKNMTKY